MITTYFQLLLPHSTLILYLHSLSFSLTFLHSVLFRFDIKGSWVGRSADPVKPTKKVVCRHCNTLFIPISKDQCSVIVGRHEANVVLKDNDLHIKICLEASEANRVLEILKKDSDLLGKLGVLDYR
jgi:Phosphatidylinositol-4-phosphate 5-Kinase